MSDYSLDEIHGRLLMMAKDFHNICVKNNIRYYIVGGTFLGAVRHHGFIPWDDDMDIGIPRKDYDRLVAISKSVFPSKYELKFYKTTKDSPIHYAKFIDSSTTLIEKEYKNYVEGLYIDIFPLDNYDNDSILDALTRKIVLICQGFISCHCTTNKKTGLKRIIQVVSSLINVRMLHEIQEHLIIRKRKYHTEHIINYLGAWGKREIQLKKTLGKPKLYKFEDTWLYGPSDYDKYLSSVYGEYMELPPKEKRKCTHQYYYVDFNKSYKEYQKENIKNKRI